MKPYAGQAVAAAMVAVNTGVWLLFPPPEGEGRTAFTRQVVGEYLGSTAVVLFAIALVLATRARWLEPWFAGLDKMYRAHRQVAVVGFGLLVVHVASIPWRLSPGGGAPAGLLAFAGFTIMVALSMGPRLPVLRRAFAIGYRSWRRTHRLIGFFFIMSLAHMLLVDALVHSTVVPFALLMTSYVAGVVAFLYTLVIARFVRPRRPYLVDTAQRLDRTTIELGLRPRKTKAVLYRSGQFVFVTFRRRGLREPHPFTVSSAPHESLLRLTIKAAGDFTRQLYERIEPGVKATVEGSYGMMDYRRGRRDQIWIAGGIGVTPFLSWCRDISHDGDHSIDFFYTVRTSDDALFWEEISAIASEYPQLRANLHISSEDGRLTASHIDAVSRAGVQDKDVYMCGPVPMINALSRGLHKVGVAPASIHFEEFSFR